MSVEFTSPPSPILIPCDDKQQRNEVPITFTNFTSVQSPLFNNSNDIEINVESFLNFDGAIFDSSYQNPVFSLHSVPLFQLGNNNDNINHPSTNDNVPASPDMFSVTIDDDVEEEIVHRPIPTIVDYDAELCKSVCGVLRKRSVVVTANLLNVQNNLQKINHLLMVVPENWKIVISNDNTSKQPNLDISCAVMGSVLGSTFCYTADEAIKLFGHRLEKNGTLMGNCLKGCKDLNDLVKLLLNMDTRSAKALYHEHLSTSCYSRSTYGDCLCWVNNDYIQDVRQMFKNRIQIHVINETWIVTATPISEMIDRACQDGDIPHFLAFSITTKQSQVILAKVDLHTFSIWFFPLYGGFDRKTRDTLEASIQKQIFDKLENTQNVKPFVETFRDFEGPYTKAVEYTSYFEGKLEQNLMNLKNNFTAITLCMISCMDTVDSVQDIKTKFMASMVSKDTSHIEAPVTEWDGSTGNSTYRDSFLHARIKQPLKPDKLYSNAISWNVGSEELALIKHNGSKLTKFGQKIFRNLFEGKPFFTQLEVLKATSLQELFALPIPFHIYGTTAIQCVLSSFPGKAISFPMLQHTLNSLCEIIPSGKTLLRGCQQSNPTENRFRCSSDKHHICTQHLIEEFHDSIRRSTNTGFFAGFIDFCFIPQTNSFDDFVLANSPSQMSMAECIASDKYQHAMVFRYAQKNMDSFLKAVNTFLFKSLLDKGARIVAPMVSNKRKYWRQQMNSLRILIRHTVEDNFFEAKRSTIQNAGRGLFAKCDLPRGTILEFAGVDYPQTNDDSFKPYAQTYYVGEGNQLWIKDSAPKEEGQLPASLASVANDCRNPRYYNCTNTNFGSSFEPENVFLELTRDVKAGEELFWSYGDQYWSAYASTYNVPEPRPSFLSLKRRSDTPEPNSKRRRS